MFNIIFIFSFSYISLLGLIFPNKILSSSYVNHSNHLLGRKVDLISRWVGKKIIPKNTPILILAGHADSQGLAGSGTAGFAVDLDKKLPMHPEMSDELFWNLKVMDAVVRIGKIKGLNISSYDPINRNIIDANDPNTNWSVGAKHVRNGGYALEIHFDSYGEYGFGSGLIPAIDRNLNSLDESLGNTFGRYPIFFRGGLGAPRRGIRVLEVAKLEGELEKKLRDPISQKQTINKIAYIIVEALEDGFIRENENNL